MKPKLTIELVPKTCWYSNVRSEVSKVKWDEIRNTCYGKAGHKCQICGDTGTNQGYGWKVECHEVWHYDDAEGIQKLMDFISLCPKCHKVKHLGHSRINGEYDMCVKHLRKVNKWNKKKTDKYLEEVNETYMQRSQYDWELDITLVDKYGLLNDLNEMMKRFNKN